MKIVDQHTDHPWQSQPFDGYDRSIIEEHFKNCRKTIHSLAQLAITRNAFGGLHLIIMHQKLYTRSSLAQPVTVVETAAEEAHRKIRNAKRLAKIKLSRIAPSTDPPVNDSSSKEDIDDEILERCLHCPPHRKRRGKFRPLIGNDGEFLCDGCYQSEFPATAFLDETEKSEWQRRGGKITDKIRSRVTDTIADVMGATEAVDGADERSSIDFPSEVECRMCLEKGVFRRCCSTYYCHSCYYQSGICPGCEEQVPLTGVSKPEEDPPGKVAVRLSWVISVLIIVLMMICLGLFYWNEMTSPVTIGHTCRGFFPTCHLSVCIDFDGKNGYGEVGSWIPAAEPYHVCERNTTSRQIVGSACIYDNEMYTWSNKLLGYDLCISSPREERTRPTNVSLANPLLLYDKGGVYVFDDDFEFPLRRASAPWQEIVNGNYSNDCGVNSAAPERGNHGGFESAENRNALVFTGVHVRHAITEGVKLPHGGSIEWYLKMGPLSSNVNSKCKPAYDGDVSLEYSRDGIEYVQFGLYPAWKYRGDEFHFISVNIPDSAWSNSTRFRFRQESFDESRDHWAIDDVRIRANLKPEWQESSEFISRQRISNDVVQRGACCYDTDECSIFDKKYTKFEFSDCDRIPQFDYNKSMARLKSSELYIFFALFAFIAKIAYQRVFEYYKSIAQAKTNSRSPVSIANDDFPRMAFHAVTQMTWQYSVAFVLLLALTCVLVRFFSALDGQACFSASETCYVDGFLVFICTVALMFDMKAIKTILQRVLVIEKPMEFLVDLHPENAILQIEGRDVPLSEVSGISRRNAGFVWCLSLCYIVGGLPVALGSLTLRSFRLQSTSEVWYTILGLVSILREIFGVPFLAKFLLCMQWFLAFRQNDREDFGRVLRRNGLAKQFVIGSSFTTIIVMSTVIARQVGSVDSVTNLIILASCILLGGLLGLLIGIMHGLPVVPEAYLTCWPSTCYCITYNDKALCPCLFSCTSCAEMNSRHVLLVVTVDEMLALKKMLGGTLSPRQEHSHVIK